MAQTGKGDGLLIGNDALELDMYNGKRDRSVQWMNPTSRSHLKRLIAPFGAPLGGVGAGWSHLLGGSQERVRASKKVAVAAI